MDAEITDMELVHHTVFWLSQGRLGERIPACWFEGRVREIDDLTSFAIDGQTKRIRIGDEVMFHLAGLRHIDIYRIKIIFALPIWLARNRPYARSRVISHRL